MKLTIDISHYDYQAVKRHVEDGIYDYNGLLARINKAIANGTPLNVLTSTESNKVYYNEDNSVLLSTNNMSNTFST